MPQAIGAAVLATIGVSSATAGAAFLGTTLAGFVGSTILSGVLLGAQLLLAEKPKVPEPADGKQSMKQALPPAIYGYGRDRNGGAYAAYKSKGAKSYDVIAFHQGEIDGYETFYLHDDIVTFDAGQVDGPVNYGKGRYRGYIPPDLIVQIFWRRGLRTETPYSQMVSALPNAWTPDHRGDTIASALLLTDTPSEKQYTKRLPFGLPRLSVVARWQRCWDPRDPTQIETDPTTWKWTRNPFVCLLNFYCHCPAGYGRPVGRVYAPVAAYWRAAMDKCDEEVLRGDGTVEPRYTIGGHFDTKTARSGVVGAMLRSCDGWLAERGDGAIVVYAGWYYEPAVVIEDLHIYDIDIRRGRMADERITQLNVQINSPDHNYGKVAADPWVNQAEIDAGAQPVARDVEAEWCQSWTQGRRLAQIEFDKARCKIRGTMVLRPYGENLRGRRFFMLNYGRRASTRMVPCEITDFHDEMFTNGSYRVEFQSVDPARYDWDTSKEGRRPAIPDNSDDADDLPKPPQPTVAVIRETIGGTLVAKISATSPPVEGWPNLSLTGRFRKVGASTWRNMTAPDDAVLQVLSDAVEDGNYEVQTAYVGGGGDDGDWSPTATITIISDNVAPGTPENLKVSSLSGSTVEISQRGKTNDTHTRFLRLRGGVPGTPVANMPTLDVQAGLAGDVRTFAETLTPQVKHYYGDALNGSGIASVAPAGPLVVTIPGQTFSDAFAYSDGALTTVAPANWTRIGGTAGSAQVVSGKVQAAISGTTLYAAPDTFAPNMWVSAEWLAAAASTNGIVAIVVDSSNYIWARYRGTMWELMKRVAGGSNVTIASQSAAIPAVGSEVRLEKAGAALTLKVAGATIVTGSLGSDLLAASRPGFVITTAVAGDFLDNFKAGISS
ncbi:hypothetical protein [Methylopila sp. Yamaguchi]|uniref:hypothetical protein n=1 Tax=Methylopila sp. Yamaguchi TaxID=1437817 RepID=UPI000CACD7DE|nr:hypothetical protein [Methylopila sp. Yamaguchi]GBD48108.1 hypothetical protein METY_1321 [Methylopila sp. Yamaguchi]